MAPRIWIMIGCCFAAAGVLLGAYGAHGLEKQLVRLGVDSPGVAERIETRWEPAVRYQMIHAIAIVLAGALAERRRSRWLDIAAIAFAFGIVVFSGLLFVLTCTGEAWRWLGMVVPFGGLAFVAGWIALALAAWSRTDQDAPH